MKTTPRNGQAGFTLIELMAVITIIVILAGLVIGGLGYVTENQAKSKAQVQISLLSKALEEYKLDMGMYPASGNVTSVSKPNGSNNSAAALYIPLFYEGWDYTRQSSPPATWTKRVGTADVPKATEIYLTDLDPTSTKQGWVDVVGGNNPVPPASTTVKDPWGNQYCYRSALSATGSTNSGTQNPDFDLWTMGKNGMSNAGGSAANLKHADNRDDIRNF